MPGERNDELENRTRALGRALEAERNLRVTVRALEAERDMPCYLCAVPGKDTRCRTSVCASCGERLKVQLDATEARVAALEGERDDARHTAEMMSETLEAMSGTDAADVPCYRMEEEELQRMPFVVQGKVRELLVHLELKRQEYAFAAPGETRTDDDKQ